jgi:iron complex outermembrane recepter protein
VGVADVLFSFRSILMKPANPRLPLAAACAALCAISNVAWAQNSSPSASATQKLDPIVVTGNPLRLVEPGLNVQRLSGDELTLQQQNSLGETLSALPGVSTTQFGPGASRPILRGLDGDRIRILNNSGATADVSALSFDHAVPIDPLVIESIEVLNGPSALLYGGNALGGVVNVLDNRIPQSRMSGISGRAQLSLGSGDRSNSTAVVLDGGANDLAWHADAYTRRAKDQAVPITLPCAKPGAPALAERTCNSQSQASGGAFGASAFIGDWRVGASASTHGSVYGSVAEDDVRIDMRSNRLAADARYLGKGWVREAEVNLSASDYAHTEFEGPTPGTRFTLKATEAKLQITHAPLDVLTGFSGVIGVQTGSSKFSAIGEEAFAPPSRTQQTAIYGLERTQWAGNSIALGVRAESVRVQAQPDASTAAIPRFTAQTSDFAPMSASLELGRSLSPNWRVVGEVTHNERAPKDYELYANGPHVATAAYEIGDATLPTERLRGLQLGLRFKDGANTAQLQAFRQRFSRFLLLDATGQSRFGDGELVTPQSQAARPDDEAYAEYSYRLSAATFTGFEASGNWRVLEGGRSTGKLDVQWKLDSVTATDTNSGQALPRIAPRSAGLTIIYAQGPWGARIGAEHKASARDGSAAAYTLWNAALSLKQPLQSGEVLWFAKLNNASNRVAFSATSILTQSAPGRVPLPGRSLTLGGQSAF